MKLVFDKAIKKGQPYAVIECVRKADGATVLWEGDDGENAWEARKALRLKKQLDKVIGTKDFEFNVLLPMVMPKH